VARRDIRLDSQDRLDARALAFGRKIRDSVHHAMVGEGQRGHAHLCSASDERVESIRSVQKAELGVAMQMYKIAAVGHRWGGLRKKW